MKSICFKKELFGDYVEIVLKDTHPFFARDVVEDVYDYALALQKKFNFFDKASELSKLNTNKSLIPSDDLLRVLRTSLEICRLSKGEYDVTLGKRIRNRKKGLPLTDACACSYRDVRIEGKQVTLLNDEVEIDLGSIAKGYIVDRMVDFLVSRGVLSGLIDARGDIRVFGNKPEIIEIQHPRKRDKAIFTLSLKGLSVATSGDYSQYFRTYETCHILNRKELISVTVVAPTLEEADVYATALFVSERSTREKIMRHAKHIKALTVDAALGTRSYNDFEDLQKGVS